MLFDTSAFLGTQQQGATSTKYKTVPNATYVAAIRRVSAHEAHTKEGDKAVLDIFWNLADVARLQDKTLVGLPVKQGIFLDLTPEGNLDMGEGMNVRLGRLREAVRQNDPARPWAPSMLVGQIAEIEVSSRINEEDGEIYNDVKRVNAL